MPYFLLGFATGFILGVLYEQAIRSKPNQEIRFRNSYDCPDIDVAEEKRPTIH